MNYVPSRLQSVVCLTQAKIPVAHVQVTLDTATVFEHGGDVIVNLLVSERLAGWIDAYDNENEMQRITLCVYSWRYKGFEYMLDMTDADAQAMDTA